MKYDPLCEGQMHHKKHALLRVPGLGPDTVNRILKIRRERRISRLEDLRITAIK
jgi:predicted DNA-binding helix-hairpin-helix protein